MFLSKYGGWFEDKVKEIKGDSENRDISVCEFLHAVSNFILELEKRMDETDDLSERKELYDIISSFYREINKDLQKQVNESPVSLGILYHCDIRFEALNRMFNKWTELSDSLADETMIVKIGQDDFFSDEDFMEDPKDEILNLDNMWKLEITYDMDDIRAIKILMEKALAQLLQRIKSKDPNAGPSDYVKKLKDNITTTIILT